MNQNLLYQTKSLHTRTASRPSCFQFTTVTNKQLTSMAEACLNNNNDKIITVIVVVIKIMKIDLSNKIRNHRLPQIQYHDTSSQELIPSKQECLTISSTNITRK